VSQIYDLQNTEATNSGTFWSLSQTDAIKARNKQAATSFNIYAKEILKGGGGYYIFQTFSKQTSVHLLLQSKQKAYKEA